MKTPAIRNIIFDLGGVILNIDFNRLTKAFQDLGIRDFNKTYSPRIQSDIFDRLEKGIISPPLFRNEIRRFIPIELSDERIDEAWNSILLDIPEKRIRLLEKLRGQYRIFMLSNTNKIHYRHYTRQLSEKYGYEDFGAIFEKAYFSFELKMRKPSPEIFQHVIRENNLKPAETLFIDDSVQHINTAVALHMKTYLLSAEKDITEVFDPESLGFIRK